MIINNLNDWEYSEFETIRATAFTNEVGTGDRDIVLQVNYSNTFDLYDIISDISQRIGDVEGKRVYVYRVDIQGLLD